MAMRQTMRTTTGAFALCLLLAGCQQDMARQPAYRPLRPSDFFDDGRSARPLVAGTVPRGFLREDVHFYTGRRFSAEEWAAVGDLIDPFKVQPGVGPLVATAAYYDTFPGPVTRADLERGRERFNIYCAVCHDRSGSGRGMIVRRGFTPPPNFHTDLSRGLKVVSLREAPVGYFFEVISRGYGAMPDYAAQVEPRDRWAVVAYIRALQFSQRAPLDDVPEAERKRLLESTR
jgi:mono/diheme cytochrome c family protein